MELIDYKQLTRDITSKCKYLLQIFLYGSRARKTHREDSDIDIALITPTGVPYSLTRWKLRKHKKHYGKDLFLRPISKRRLRKGKNPKGYKVITHIKDEGVLLYEKCRGEIL